MPTLFFCRCFNSLPFHLARPQNVENSNSISTHSSFIIYRLIVSPVLSAIGHIYIHTHTHQLDVHTCTIMARIQRAEQLILLVQGDFGPQNALNTSPSAAASLQHFEMGSFQNNVVWQRSLLLKKGGGVTNLTVCTYTFGSLCTTLQVLACTFWRTDKVTTTLLTMPLSTLLSLVTASHL